MRFRMAVFCMMALVLTAGCNLISNRQVQTLVPTQTTPVVGKPLVTILSPSDNAEVVVNTAVQVNVNANDPVGVTRVQLLANGSVVRTISSEAPSGDTNLNAVLDYSPRTIGALRLDVIAYRGTVPSDPASIDVSVRQSQAQVTATLPGPIVPTINPNDPTCRAQVNASLRLRTGPGINYDILTVLSPGVIVPLVGRLGTNEWWQARVNTTIGWISAGYFTLYGNCGGIPIVNAPPTPTSRVPTLTPTLAPTITPTRTPTGIPSPADLVITNFSGPGTLNLNPVNTPVSATFTLTVSNTGSSPTNAFSNIVTVTPLIGDIPVTAVGNLNPGESLAINVNVTFSVAGTYTLTARADSLNQVSEISEVNNTANWTIVIVPSAPLATDAVISPLAAPPTAEPPPTAEGAGSGG